MKRVGAGENLILYADDDADDRQLFCEIVQTDSYVHWEIHLAKDGAEALEHIRQLQPGLIFLDLNMPMKNGIECLNEVRREERSPVVVLFSTSKSDIDVDAAFDAGASLYLCKPHSYTQLVESIKLVLALYRNGCLNNTTRERFLLTDPKKYNRNFQLPFATDK